MQFWQASVFNEAAAQQFPHHLHFLPAKYFLHPYFCFHCNPPEVQTSNPHREGPQPAASLPFPAGRGSQGLTGSKHCPHLSCLDLMETLHRHPQLPSCSDKWAVLVPCQSRPSCVDVGSPFPRSCHSSIAGSARLACHGTCHVMLKPVTFEGQTEIQAET